MAAAVSPLAPKGGFPDLAPIAGVRLATIAAGVKYRDRRDVLLAHITAGSAVAGVFTKSSTRSAPVLDCQAKLAAGALQGDFALLVNSGNSNAFTGSRGSDSVAAICSAVAKQLDLPQGNVFTASTGVIGEPLPHEKITAKIADLGAALGTASLLDGAEAIMTTDTYAKGAGATVEIGGKTVRIAGIAKGSGMIAPDMATMLVYLFTDAKISSEDLQSLIAQENQTSFNAITVDSDTSTSDSLMAFATGASGVAVAGNAEFTRALRKVMLDLAHQVVRDGEGATKFVEISVRGAVNAEDARKVALSVANSPLVKTAIAGEDANWGRVVMAVGKSGAQADRDRLTIRFGDILVAENGWVAPSYTEETGAAYMKGDEILIDIDLGLGDVADRVWTCDLTHGYITINADYRS